MDFSISKHEFIIDGVQAPLLCGELQYFRMPKAIWEESLDRLVEAGCNAVAYYVPWFVHEPQEGTFDFDGRLCPENDLISWIELTIRKGLIGYLRPGPYVYAETTDLGLPRWFGDNYRQAHSQQYKDGQYVEYGLPRYAAHNHPEFLRATKNWYKAVMERARPYLAPQGNIYLLQLCNEIPGEDHMDENPETMGIGNPEGLFPSYLREQYNDITMLNKHYCTSFATWESIEPYMLREASGDKWESERHRYYYDYYYPLYFVRLREFMGVLPEQVTLVHNAYNPKAISLHYQIKRKNPWLNIGIDCYYSLSGSLSLREGIYYCEYGSQYSLAMLDNPPWVIEQECGYWFDYPQVYGPELYIWNIWTFAAGYKGINMYLFGGCDNRDGMGFYGTEHNWQAPLRKDGTPNHTYHDIRRSLFDIRRDYPLLCADNRYDIALGVKHTSGLIWSPLANHTREAFTSLRVAGFTPRVVDFEGMTLDELGELPVLMVVSNECMDSDVQQRLADYAAGGGKLICNGCLPWMEENRNPCTLLAEALGVVATPIQHRQLDQEKLVLEGVEYCINHTIQVISAPQGEVYATNPRTGEVAAQRVNNTLLIPFHLQLLFSSTGVMLRNLLGKLGVHPYCRMSEHLLAIPKVGGHYVVLNLHPCAFEEGLELDGNTVNLRLEPYSYQIL